MGRGLGSTQVWMGVTVGKGVNVFGGVEVAVGIGVNVGTAACVCRNAASAVCAITMLIALGSSGGIGVGVARTGTQPAIKVRAVKKINNLIFDVGIFADTLAGRG